MNNKPITAIIVGGGHRSFIYGDYALAHPDELKIVGIADPDSERCKTAMDKFGFSDDYCFSSAEELAKVPKFADAIINGTMDQQHVYTAVPLLKKGYDMLLEKPFACNEEEMNTIINTVKENGNRVMICHVLRYAVFYNKIKQRIENGDIGKIINIQTSEDVSYHHISTSYVRGKWANSNECGTSMLLAKCCHDIDIMMWLMSETEPEYVSSFGSIFQFKEEAAPKGSGKKCLVDCKYSDSCIYSSKRLYVDHPDRWTFYVWHTLLEQGKMSEKDRIEHLKTDTPYSKCIFRSNNNVVDHQSVLVGFKNGATGTHNMTGGTPYSQRLIRIIGTKGSIYGKFEDNKFTVSIIDPSPNCEHKDEVVDISNEASAYEGHGGGDSALVKDFVKFVKGEKTSNACTDIFDSIAGHACVFGADYSMAHNGESVKLNLK